MAAGDLSIKEVESIGLMHIQAYTDLLIFVTMRTGLTVSVDQDGGRLVVLVFWGVHQWQH